MPNFLKKKDNTVVIDINITISCKESEQSQIISDLKTIAINLNANEINIVRKLSENNTLKILALNQAKKYIS